MVNKRKKQRQQGQTARETIDVWPTVGGILGMGKNACYAAAQRGDFPVIKIGRRYLVPRSAFERWLECQPIKPVT